MRSYSDITNIEKNINGSITILSYIYINSEDISIDFQKTYFFYSLTEAKRKHKKKLSKLKKMINNNDFQYYYDHTIKVDNEILNYY